MDDQEFDTSKFPTECYSYGPTAGGGRIYTAKGARSHTRVRGTQAKARRALKATYRRMFKKAVDRPSFKVWARKQAKKAAA